MIFESPITHKKRKTSWITRLTHSQASETANFTHQELHAVDTFKETQEEHLLQKQNISLNYIKKMKALFAKSAWQN